ncbi:MAG: glutamine amidotransferase, partial [Planctomycetia bacterium]
MTPLYWLLGLDAAASITRVGDWVWRAAAPLPLWAIALVAAVGLTVAAFNFLPQTVATWPTRLLLALVRLAGFALILILLCQLEARLTVERSPRPTIAVLTDTSASMGLQDVAGASRLAAARKFADQLTEAVGSRAEVVGHDFDWQLRPSDPAAQPDRPTRLIEAIAETARTENDLRAIVCLTDGNDTAGDRGQLLAPVLAARPLPVYPVVFGSETAPRLARVQINSGAPYVRLGDELRIAATITANQLGEQQVTVRLMEEGRPDPIAVREKVSLGADPVEFAFVVKPDKAGEKLYRVVVDGVRDAVSESLQVAEHRVSVLDAKIRVLYLDIPRDERKILGHWIARDPVVEAAFLTMMPKGGWYAQGTMHHKNAGDGLPSAEADLCRYDVVVLGDIPRSYFREGGDTAETKMQWLGDFVGRRGGGLVLLGGRSVYAAGQYHESTLARLAPFQIEPTKDPQVDKAFRITPTVAGLGHPIMRLEGDPAANRDAWYDLPALDGNNRVGGVKPSATLLAVRELPEGPMPVIAVQNVGRGQVLGLSADTTWRWEMMRPADGEDYFRRFWGNVVRAIAPDPRLQPDRPQIGRLEAAAEVGK